MGAVSWLVGQAAITSLTLGFLKHHQIIQFNAEHIPDSSTRRVFLTAASLGEQSIVWAENMWPEIRKPER